MVDPFSAERLKEIEAAIKKINHFLDGKSFEDFRDNDMLRDAVLRNLTIISEASIRLDGEIKAATPEVNWFKWTDLGEHLIRSYDTLDDHTLWEAITDGLPKLAAATKQVEVEPSSAA